MDPTEADATSCGSRASELGTPAVSTGDRFVRVMLMIGVLGLVGTGLGTWNRIHEREAAAYGGNTLPLKDGNDLVALYIGSSTCHGSKLPGFRDVEQQTMSALAARAERSGMRFVRVGVAVDKSPIIGRKYLDALGPWDATSTGDGWLNPEAVSYIWRDMPAEAVLPQIVVLQRSVRLSVTGPIVGRDSLLGRIVGMDGMIEWLRDQK